MFLGGTWRNRTDCQHTSADGFGDKFFFLFRQHSNARHFLFFLRYTLNTPIHINSIIVAALSCTTANIVSKTEGIRRSLAFCASPSRKRWRHFSVQIEADWRLNYLDVDFYPLMGVVLRRRMSLLTRFVFFFFFFDGPIKAESYDVTISSVMRFNRFGVSKK